jgi:hypothetical protein
LLNVLLQIANKLGFKKKKVELVVRQSPAGKEDDIVRIRYQATTRERIKDLIFDKVRNTVRELAREL